MNKKGKLFVLPVFLMLFGCVDTPQEVYQATEKDDLRMVAYTDMGPQKSRALDLQIIGPTAYPGVPDAKLVLFKMIDENMRNSTVAGGMSGSPVMFENGKVFGAISHMFSNHTEINYGGITPLEYMIDHKNYGNVTPSSDSAFQIDVFTNGMSDYLRNELLDKIFEGRAVARQMAVSAPLTGFTETPGLTARVSVRGEKSKPEIKGGDGFTVFLMVGHVSLGASGTITYVDEEKETFLGFGHPFLGLGDKVQMPVAKAKVLSVVKSNNRAYKVFAEDETQDPYIGAITDDFFSGVEGRLGLRAPMLLVDFTLVDGPVVRSYSFETIRHNFFTPLLVENGINSLIEAFVPNMGDGTFNFRAKIEFEGDYPEFLWSKTLVVRPTLAYMGPFSVVKFSPKAAVKKFSNIVQSIMRSGFPELKIKHISFDVEKQDNVDQALFLDSAVLLDENRKKVSEVKMGKKYNLVMVLRTFDARTRYLLTEEIEIPDDFKFMYMEMYEKSGRRPGASIFIESGNNYKERDPQNRGDPFGDSGLEKEKLFDSTADFIDFINDRNKVSSNLYIQVVFPQEIVDAEKPNIALWPEEKGWVEVELETVKEFRKYDAVLRTNRVLKRVVESPDGVVVNAKADFSINLVLKK